jgi:hypothetical protein
LTCPILKEISKDYFITGEAYTRAGKARILKGVCTPEYIYTNKPRYDRDLKNTDVVNHAFLYIISQRTWGQNNKRASGNFFNSYANLSSDIDLMNGPADVMIQTEGNHEMDKTGHRVL